MGTGNRRAQGQPSVGLQKTSSKQHLHLNLPNKNRGGESSKPGSQQSTARNLPKGTITFHNKQLETSKDYDSKTKRKKEHPTFFEVMPTQISLDKPARQSSKEPKQSFVNFLNKAPLPKPVPGLLVKQDSLASHAEANSNTNTVPPSLAQPEKSRTCVMSDLLAELKSLFFYEESTTLRDKLRSIVTRYETLACDANAVLKYFDERNRSTSLGTKERLKAFMHRQDYLNRRGDSQMQTGSVTLKDPSPNELAMSKEDFDELDLRNSI